MASKQLSGKVCLVTGASRGIGKGIALQLGEAGATVYITGRTLNPNDDRAFPGSLRETAEEVEERGGKCVPVQCDHSDDEQVKSLFERISREQNGRLDLLVNNAFAGGKTLFESRDKKFWETPPTLWDDVTVVGLRSYYIAAWHAAQLMIPAKQGLIVNISSIGGLHYFINVPYSVGKVACDRMATDCALELRTHNVACVSLWPGIVKTESLMDMMASIPEAAKKDEQAMVDRVESGESLEFSGKAVAHLASDPNIMKKSGRILQSAELAEEYGFTDVDGQPPLNWRRLKTACAMSGHTWVAALIPGFIKIPFWLIAAANSKL
ncbi:dehydrogenase/reductase SDR family member 1-like [Acanthaster planci]|uniref:Dehydrogenase/reductase SDR family member 1-like n=1 Tax=Acanthaster planci TaxID=133434 RepID=A0A8B7ZCK3_ACAPL|nr:dehydrogenase/reductase SDR family member 1-like [Acanthaster planci]